MKKSKVKRKENTIYTNYFLHIIFCGTLLVIGMIGTYLFNCTQDNVLTKRELTVAFEYFFICITELLILGLSFDIMFELENQNAR